MTPAEQLRRSVRLRQERGPKELAELLIKEDADRVKREALLDHHSRVWNERQRAMRNAAEPAVAESEEPEGLSFDEWSKLHWKQRIKEAGEIAGRQFESLDEATAYMTERENGRD